MANSFLTPDLIATRALATLYDTTVMAQLVHRDYDADFRGRQGDTVTVRKPAVFTAAEFNRGTGIVSQNAVEGSVDVTLNHFSDVSFTVTTEQLNLEIEDFGTQLLDPAMEAIAQKIDTDLLALRDDIVQSTQDVDSPHATTAPEVLIDAGIVLNQAKVPAAERRAVIGPATNGRWLDSNVLKQVNESGSTDGLREAYVGRRLFGFDPYWTQHVESPEEGVAFHRTAFALVMRPLEVPPGAQDAVIMDYKGFSLRVVYDYDIKYKQTVVSVDCLYGTKTLDANRAVILADAGS
ncbi:P22 phage major capsid protein family protein [Streptomyces sp. L2]|uniref:P22 phage major capsid protein family protein n=1 Tax=Streptomyces sp. L2 TaxID=2162665 RepID=UPI0010129D6B|nr:P22 phage major capsid protein family protein [Streptomyces sp. L2]